MSSHTDAVPSRQWLTPEFFVNPYSFYDELLSSETVHWSDDLNSWLLARYDHVVSALRDPRTFSSAGRMAALLDQVTPELRVKLKPMYDTYSVGMIQSDPPGHTRLRMLLNKVFTPAEVDRLRSRIEVLVGELLDRVQPDGRMDAINDFAYPLPVTVLCEILGVPVDRRDQIGTWTANVNRTVSGTCPLNECADQAQSSVLEMRAYFAELVEQRREQPRDDLLSLLVAAEEAGDKLSMDELQTTVVMLISAGHETTTSLIGNGLLTLLQHPDQLRQLRENPDLMSAAIDEILRYESPLQRQTRRVAEDAEFGGRQIRKGQMVSVLLGAANRDPSVFSDPDRFDIRREDNKHIAFGFGIHSCLGRFLSRLEGTIAFDAILRRFPKLQLETEEIKWQHHVAVRCVESLPVSF